MTYNLCSPQDVQDIFVRAAKRKPPIHFHKDQILFRQDEPADFVFYLCSGKVRLSVLAPNGKEAIVALLGCGQLAGEKCLASSPRCLSTATAMTDTLALRVDKSALERMFVIEPRSSTTLLGYVLSKNARSEGILVDQMFDTSEKRLARLLLTMSRLEEAADRAEAPVSGISQGALGEMIGTSRETVNLLMSKFRRLGYIQNSNDALVVKKSISSILAQTASADGSLLNQVG